ncbi:MAG: NitT/TauT family transport system ATP-binding protein [Nocardioidaceae bacterium]|nr:NitT/TauT family transport system ATP-binding protein [Nocardioidaceae bacterium]
MTGSGATPLDGEQPTAGTTERAGQPAGQPVLAARHVNKAYVVDGESRVAVADISFEVFPGEFVCVVGPSGAGKTTLLRCLSGLMPPTSGETLFEGQAIDRVPEKLSVVFQDYSRSLFPWSKVARNVELPLKVEGVGKDERRARVEEMLAAVGLAGAGDRYPWQLSGGMQQRVAIARALAFRPELLLMDEPFASVDAQTRFELEDMILKIRDDFGVTVVLVTHDIDEAVYLADRVVVLSKAPSTVQKLVDVPLERPRNQVRTRNDPEFAHLRTHILELVTTG